MEDKENQQSTFDAQAFSDNSKNRILEDPQLAYTFIADQIKNEGWTVETSNEPQDDSMVSFEKGDDNNIVFTTRFPDNTPDWLRATDLYHEYLVAKVLSIHKDDQDRVKAVLSDIAVMYQTTSDLFRELGGNAYESSQIGQMVAGNVTRSMIGVDPDDYTEPQQAIAQNIEKKFQVFS